MPHADIGRDRGARISGTPRSGRPRVLIVEDDFIIAQHLSDELTANDYVVVGTAPDAQTALIMAEDEKPDIAIVDVNLKGSINGVSTARELLRRHTIKVIFATAFGDVVAREARDVASVILVKPYTIQEALSALDEIRTKSE